MIEAACRTCGFRLRAKHKFCPSCGAKNPWSGVNTIISLIVLGSIGFGVTKYVSSIPPSTTESRLLARCSPNGEYSAFLAAQDFIKERLKAPSTASFVSYGSSRTGSKQLVLCDFEVMSAVDAQNSFGATIRSSYTVRLRYLPEKDDWMLLSLR